MTTTLTRVPAPATTRPTLRRVGNEPDAATEPWDVDPPPFPTHAAAESRPRPGAREAVTVALRIACEVLDGRRPPTHLATHADESVVRYWRATTERRRSGPCTRHRASTGQRSDVGARSRARFARMRLCHPHPAAAEVAVALEIDGGVRAVAARFDHRGGRWRCTALRLC